MHEKRYVILLSLIISFILFPAGSLYSGGSKDTFTAATDAYAAGDFEQALNLYEEAEVNMPESPHIYFNKGLSYYRLEDYEKAKESFLSAATKTKDLGLEAKAYYNLGNTAIQEASRHTETDLEKAIELYREAITNYQVALERDKSLTDAAHNIEVARLIVRDLLDKLKKQQEQNKGQQEKIEEIVKKIAELIEREGREIEYTTTLKEEKDTKGTSQSLQNNVNKVRKEQSAIRKETGEVSVKLNELMSQGVQGQGGQPQSNPQLGAAKEHVDLSANFQDLAINQLKKTDLGPAIESESGAREELIKALEALAQPQNQQNQEQQNKEQNEEQQQKEEEMEKQAEDAEDIIDEEREERRDRQVQGQTGYREVERDW